MFSQVKGQEENRRPDTFVDQHKREYFAPVDNKTGDPCTTLEPHFKAPLKPDWFRKMLIPPVDDPQIVKMVPRLERARRGYQVFIDYDAWLSKLAQRDEEWDQRLHDLAKGMSGGMEVVKLVENPPPALKHYIGRRPFPPRILVEAMKAGNAWALGLTDKIPKKVEALLADLESDLVQTRRVRLGNAVADPLADDDEPTIGGALADAAVEDVDPFGEEEEHADPKALGGKTVPIRPKPRGRPKKTNTPALPPAA